jgi:CHAD domain-containing protein
MSFDIDRIQKSSRRVAKFVRKNVKKPSSKAIHDLRTGAHRVETTFTTLGLRSKKTVKRLLRDMENVRKRAGKVRDMDVLTAHALTIKPEGEQDCLVQLLEFLGAKRNTSAKKLRSTIQKPGRLHRDLKRNSKRVEKLLRTTESNPTETDAMSATLANAIKLSSDLNRPARLNRDNLHPYRLKVKELRDILQLSDRAEDLEFVKKLAEVKDAIGEWHDWEELLAISKQMLDHSNCNLIKQLMTTSHAKYDHALSLTHQLRNNYVRAGRSKQRTRHTRTRLSTPILEATSAIAER